MESSLTIEQIAEALDVDAEVYQKQDRYGAEDVKKYYNLRDKLMGDYNINFILIYSNFKYSANDNSKINLANATTQTLKYLYTIFQINNFVCVYSKLHCFGVIKTAGNLQRFKFITTAIDDKNGFKNCDRIEKCKMVDITDFTIDLDSFEIETIFIQDYDSYNYSMDKKTLRKKQFLQALMYDDIRKD